MPGAVAANFHEGSRSESLARYVFTSWGTAVQIPHEEDHGLDLLCSLTERSGYLAWARSVYTVQVKSELSPWVFEGEGAVRWLIEHPLPLFLCIVDKSASRLRIYQTAPRFWMWALGTLPERLVLSPGQDEEGRTAQWKGKFEFSLGAPVLDFTLNDVTDEAFHDKAAGILQFWIGIDNANLTRIRSGLPRFSMPQFYKTNDMIRSAWESHCLAEATEEQIQMSLYHIKEAVLWLGSRLHQRGDISGAVKASILLDHLNPEGLYVDLWHCLWKLNERLRDDNSKEWKPFAGIHRLGAMVDERIVQAMNDNTCAEGGEEKTKKPGAITTLVQIGRLY